MVCKDQNSLVICEAAKEDFETLSNIYLRAVLNSRANQLKETPRQTVSGMTRYFNNLLNRQMWDSKAHILVAREGNELAGFTCSMGAREEDCAIIETVFIDPQYWRKGIGRELVSAILERQRVNLSRRVVLWADRDDSGVRRFYAAMGWRETGEEQENSKGRIKHLVQYGFEIKS